MHFDPKIINIGLGFGHGQQRVTHTKTNLYHPFASATKGPISIKRPLIITIAKARKTLIPTLLLAFGHTPGAHHKTANATLIVFGHDAAVRMGKLSIV
jgi:hypothetical protein